MNVGGVYHGERPGCNGSDGCASRNWDDETTKRRRRGGSWGAGAYSMHRPTGSITKNTKITKITKKNLDSLRRVSPAGGAALRAVQERGSGRIASRGVFDGRFAIRPDPRSCNVGRDGRRRRQRAEPLIFLLVAFVSLCEPLWLFVIARRRRAVVIVVSSPRRSMAEGLPSTRMQREGERRSTEITARPAPSPATRSRRSGRRAPPVSAGAGRSRRRWRAAGPRRGHRR